MIGTFVCGGLGNQMFQYAAARALAMRHGTKLQLDVASYNSRRHFEVPRPFELQKLNIDVAPVNRTASLAFWVARRRRRRFAELSGWNPFHEKSLGHYDPQVEVLPDDTYLYGYWQSWRYFSAVQDQIRRELQPRNPLSSASRRLADKMRSLNSVSFHIRRGDYLTTRGASDFHGVLGVEFYDRAISYVQARVIDAVGFVFSDDLPWCRDALAHLPLPLTFVDANSGDKSWQDMYLMAACRHKILANSSFSWWGAMLSETAGASGGIIIAPERCFTGGVNLSDRYPPDWIIR